MKNNTLLFILLLLSGMPGILLAHGPGGGGQSYEADAPQLKLGIKDPFSNLQVSSSKPGISMSVDGQNISLLITDEYGESVNTDLAEAKVFITSGGKTSWLRLIPAGGNRLSGEGDFIHSPGMRADVTLRLPGEKPINQDFYPLK
jgi:hypothetical protein